MVEDRRLRVCQGLMVQSGDLRVEDGGLRVENWWLRVAGKEVRGEGWGLKVED